MSKCTNFCSFCPQEVFQERYRGCSSLSFENFKTILSNVPKNVSIHFSGFAEPFLNAECVKMIEHAHAMGYEVQLFSTLVGLKAEDVKRIQSCVDRLVLHLPDCFGYAKIPVTESYKDTLANVLTLMRVDEFVAMGDNLVIDPRAGLLENVPANHVHGKFYCIKLIDPQFVMLPNCDVVLCCMDFGLKHNLGNLLNKSFMTLARSDEFRKVSSGRFKMDDDTICRMCAQAVPIYNLPLYRRSARKVFYSMTSILNKVLDRKTKQSVIE